MVIANQESGKQCIYPGYADGGDNDEDDTFNGDDKLDMIMDMDMDNQGNHENNVDNDAVCYGVTATVLITNLIMTIRIMRM